MGTKQRITVLDVLSGLDDSPESWRIRARWWRRTAERHVRNGRLEQAERIFARVAQMEQRAIPCLRLVEAQIAPTPARRPRTVSPAGRPQPISPAGKPRRNRIAERVALLARRVRLAEVMT